MANPEHVAKLKEGVEAWNDWRLFNEIEKPDLTELDFDEIRNEQECKLEIVDGKISFEFAELQGVDFSRSVINDVSFYRSELQESTFNNVMISECSFDGAHLDRARFKDVNMQQTEMMTETAENIWIVNSELSECDFSVSLIKGCWFIRSNFINCKFTGTRFISGLLKTCLFKGSNFKNARMIETDLTGSDFSCADLTWTRFNDVDVTWIKFNKKTKCEDTDVRGAVGSQLFKRYVEDENYLYEFKTKHKQLYFLWWLFADCGRSLGRWTAWSVFFALAFATVFHYCLGAEAFQFNSSLPKTFPTMIYYSVVTFTTLGFGDITPNTPAATWCVVLEVIWGYVMLGGLISILANKLARRS